MYIVMAQFGTDGEEGSVSNSKTSRVRSRTWFFTWNNPDDDVVALLDDIFKDVEYVCQMEIGDSDTRHLQGVIRYVNPRDKVDISLFSLCHWERCRSWRKAIKYCNKVDTRVDGPWTNIDGLKWRKTIVSPLKGKVMYDWQRDIYDMVSGDADDRKVYWYWDPIGCSGKTSLAKHLCLRYRKECLYMNGCSKDVLFALSNVLEERDVRCVIFGLSRQDRCGMNYKSLEIIKDGIGFSGKYESGMFLMSECHVIVFANFAPDRSMLSEDRWVVVEIGA